MVVTELEKTCDACPAQWEGRLEDGRYIYVRFRSGHLTIGVGATSSEAVGNSMGNTIWRSGHPADGFMDINELRKRAPQYDWPI
jgi:hypothetical protein